MAKTRANNEGNIKLRADGRYEVRVTVLVIITAADTIVRCSAK